MLNQLLVYANYALPFQTLALFADSLRPLPETTSALSAQALTLGGRSTYTGVLPAHMFSLRCVRALTLALQCALLASDSTLALEIVELLYARCHPLFGMPEKSSLLLEALLSAQVRCPNEIL